MRHARQVEIGDLVTDDKVDDLPAGLGMALISAGKVFLYDLSQLAQLYRIFSFVLLAIAFFAFLIAIFSVSYMRGRDGHRAYFASSLWTLDVTAAAVAYSLPILSRRGESLRLPDLVPLLGAFGVSMVERAMIDAMWRAARCR